MSDSIEEIAKTLDIESGDDLEMIADVLQDVDSDVAQAFFDYLDMDESQMRHVMERNDQFLYEREPPSIRQFLEDDYYLGHLSDDIYPVWKDTLFELFGRGKDYHELIVTGGVGIGKNFVSSIALSYFISKVWCLRDPQRAYNLSARDEIQFVCISVRQYLAKEVIFEHVWSKIQDSPFFQKEVQPSKMSEKIKFGKGINLLGAKSKRKDILGMNVLGGIMDEANFFEGAGEMGTAKKLYGALKRRIKSRFQTDARVPGLTCVVSSKRTRQDFLDERIDEASNDSGVLVRDVSLYEVDPDVDDKDTFRVLVGNEMVSSRILDEDEEVPDDLLQREGVFVEEVPSRYREDFERDLSGSLRDISGISTVAVSPFIGSKDKIEKNIDEDRFHPFVPEVWTCGQRGDFMWDAITIDHSGERYPKKSPSKKRHAHIDLSLSGHYTGLCVAHVDGYTEIERSVQNTSSGHENRYVSRTERVPMIYVDFVLRVEPPSGGEINIGMIRGLIYEMIDNGFPIKHITVDQFQTAETRQKFESRGMDTDLVSVERTPDPYITLKNALYEERLSLYEYQPLLQELSELQWDERTQKVETGESDNKDVADSLAAVIYTLTDEGVSNMQGVDPVTSNDVRVTGDYQMDNQNEFGETYEDYDEEGGDLTDVLPLMG